MSKKTTSLSVGYWFSAHTLGMLSHPYKSMREVARHKHLRPTVFTPLVWLAVFWLGALMAIFLGRGLAGLLGWQVSSDLLSFLEFGFYWAVIFACLWQVLSGYLYVRFMRLFD